MKRTRTEPVFARDGLAQLVALACLLLMGGWVLVGPSGLLAWSENLHMLDQRQQEVRQMSAQLAVLRNRVALLDPRHADPDLAGELLRSNLNVVHPDEMVMMIK